MKKNTAIYSVANIINKLNTQSDLHLIYQQYLYTDKQNGINDIFIEYNFPVMEYPDHPELIEEWKQNLDAAFYELFLNQDVKLP